MRSDAGDSVAALDAADPLRGFHDRFPLWREGWAYLDGNSLGRPSLTAMAAIADAAREWSERLVEGWGEWLDLPQRCGAAIATVVGAGPEEVVACDSTSVNLYKLALAALRELSPARRVLTDDQQFPSDVYILRSALEASGGGRLDVLPTDGIHGAMEPLEAALREGPALVCLSHVTFKSAYLYDMPEVCRMVRNAGGLTLWDLGHSAGVVPISLMDAGADLAVGCTYKYLNSGPGAPAYLFVRRELQTALRNPVPGWMGHARPFDFSLDYAPADDTRRFLSGTPSILAMAAIPAGAGLVLEAGMDGIRRKSQAQTEWLIRAWESRLAPLGYTLGSPREAARRGSHITLRHPRGAEISRLLRERYRVVPDFRPPDNIRLGVAPLYTAYGELEQAVAALAAAAGDATLGTTPAGPVP